jgi:hypothetical protein
MSPPDAILGMVLLAVVASIFIAILSRAAIAVFVVAVTKAVAKASKRATTAAGFDAERRRRVQTPHFLPQFLIGLAQVAVIVQGVLDAELGVPELVLEHIDDLGLRLSDTPEFFDGLFRSSSGPCIT